MVDEYIEALRGIGLQNERELEGLFGLFAHGFHVLFTAKTPNLKIFEKDHDDDKFIECAVALNSKFIISGDKALQNIKNYMGIKILNPKQFLNNYSKLKR